MTNRTHIIVRMVILASLVGLWAATTATGKTIYVDDSAVGANDGSSWADAYRYVQDALADANSAEKPVEIRVAQGIYKPDQGANQTPGDQDATFQLINGVTVKGGYAGFGEPEPDTRDVGAYETILSGDLNDDDIEANDVVSRFENSYHVVTGSSTDLTAVLDGFTITAGAPNMEGEQQIRSVGGGMYNFKGSPTLIACTFTGNWAWGGQSAGGGMYNSSSSPTLVNCTFNRNRALYWHFGRFTGYGGGMYNNSSSPVLIGCIFSSNSAWDGGGGMYNRRSSPMLLDCTFTANEGSGMQNSSGSDPMLINCIFSGNGSVFSGNGSGWYLGPGGGIHNSSGSLTIVNCTFTGNSAESGNALACESSDVYVANSILWDGGDEISKDDDSHITIAYSDVQGGWPGEGNILIDPCFAKPGYWDDIDEFWVDGDYRLQSQAGRWDPNSQTWVQDAVTSPCIDSGDNLALPPWVSTDLDGYPRITNGTVDMGAYESPEYEPPGADFFLSTKWVTVSEAETATFTVMLARDPIRTVEVTVAHRSGDADITVETGALLTFDSSNYTQPQSVTLTAAEDGDYLKGMALIWVSAPELAPAGVIAAELDNDAPPPLYVDADAVGANNGSSWADAFVNLQDALGLARMNPHIEQIRVAQGIYRPDRGDGITAGDQGVSFELIDGVAHMGGYAGYGEPDPNARDVKEYETILSGDLNGDDADLSAKPTENTYRIVEASDIDATAVIDGFTITGANATSWGGGMRNNNASTTVRNCTFRGNSTIGEGSRGEGGGLYNSRSSPTVTNCTFSANAAYWGGGMANRWSNPILINCTFIGNDAFDGGAIANEQESSLRLMNCTFSGNSTRLGDGAAIRTNGDDLVLTNCIVWGNIVDSIKRRRGEATVSYSNIQGGWPGVGNIDADPFFADPDGPDNIPGTEDDDLRLSPISPCVDAGDPNYVPRLNEIDFDGNPRMRYGRIDMGAYELQEGLIYVDDDASEDPGPGDILVSDPLENGAEPHPMDSIQEAIDVAKDGYTVLVHGGVYGEPINFTRKAITVQSGPDIAVLETPDDYAVSFYSAEEPNSVLQNFVIRNSLVGIYVSGSSPTIRNLTVVDNEYGITAYTWAEPDISNCIFWNNSEADLFQYEARYSYIEDGDQGQGNIISADPLFVDAENGDYHLKSEGWSWSTKTKSWTYDYVTSRCIDAGDPTSPLGDEPMSVPRDPNNIYGINLRINMGAYGGTAQASIPPYDWLIPEYENDPPEPDPAQWAPNGEPREAYRGEVYSGGGYWVQMTAAEATDASGGPVEYFFECTTESGFSSEWQSSRDYDFMPTIRISGQGPRFRVKARDQFGNETAWSEELATILITY